MYSNLTICFCVIPLFQICIYHHWLSSRKNAFDMSLQQSLWNVLLLHHPLQYGSFRLKHSSWPNGTPFLLASTLLADPWASTAASFRPLCRIAVPRPLLIITRLMIQAVHPGLPINITLEPPTRVTPRLMLLSSDIPLISLRSLCHLDLIGTPRGSLSVAIGNPETEQSPTYSHLQEDRISTWLTYTRPPGSDRSRSSWRRTKQATWVLLQWNRWSCQSRKWRLHR